MRQRWGKQEVAAQLLPTFSLLQKKTKNIRPHKYAGSAHTQKTPEKAAVSDTV